MVLVLAAVFAASNALAQVPAPRIYDATVTASPSQIIIANNARYSIQFCNPHKTAYVAVCPVTSGRTGLALTCVFQGAGSITLPPTWCRSISAPDRQSKIPSAWNGISESGTQVITIIETE